VQLFSTELRSLAGMNLKGQFQYYCVRLYLPALSTQAEYHGVLCWLSHWPLATTPPVPYPEAGVQMTLTPGMSDGNLGDETGAFSDDQFRANWSRPGRVSERRGEKNIYMLTLIGSVHHGSERRFSRN